jgi:hypothetical protein
MTEAELELEAFRVELQAEAIEHFKLQASLAEPYVRGEKKKKSRALVTSLNANQVGRCRLALSNPR